MHTLRSRLGLSTKGCVMRASVSKGLGAAAVLVLISTSRADSPPAAPDMVMTSIDGVKWMDAPPVLPKGAKAAVVYGDPSKPGLFVLLTKFPASYEIPAHWHPTDENVTVLKGTLYLGMGDKLDKAQGKAVATGGFASLPAKMHHFAYTKKEVIVQLTSMGPFGMTYIDPALDPTKHAAK